MTPPGPQLDESALARRLLSEVQAAPGRPKSAASARLFFAPGRVNLLGAHLDYNGGPVLPAAVDRGTLVALVPRTDGRIELRSTREARAWITDRAELPARATGAWWDYPLGVVRALAPRAPAGGGFSLHFGGNLPVGAGLSSSASICVATALAVGAAWGLELAAADLVEVALAAERGFVGVQCGLMDPFAVGYGRAGHVLWLDCKDASFEHLPLDPERVRIAVADSGVRRELARGEFNRRVDECRTAYEALAPGVPGATCLRDVPLSALEHDGALLGEPIRRRARHVIEEVQRAFRGRDALIAGDLVEFGKQLSQSHASLRDLFEVSTPELDCLVEAALEVPGVLGSRLVGAGFGGCTVILMEPAAEGAVADHLGERFRSTFGRAPEVHYFRPGPGPRELPVS